MKRLISPWTLGFVLASIVGGLPLAMHWAIAAEPLTSKITEKPPENAPQGMTLPEYGTDGKLLRPVDYERWVVVGTSVGLSYSDGPAEKRDNPGQFHNVYMQPEAFDHFVRTGQFLEQTVFIVTNNPSQATTGKDQLNRHGFFASPATGLEVSVKDTQRFGDGWGYFMFHGSADDQAPREAQSAFASADCFECHAEHGKQDAVFTQFYSVLTTARDRYLAKTTK